MITKGNFGGAQKYVYDLATKLPLDHYNPVVAMGEPGVLEEMLGSHGIRTIRVRGLQRDVNFFKEFAALRELIALFKKERPDIIHINSSKAGFTGALAGRIARVPRIIFTAHGWAFNESRSALVKKFFKLLHWATVFLSHSTIAVSERTADDMRSLPFLKNKFNIIYNGIAPREFAEKQTIRTLLAPSIYEAVWIGTVSELHRNKGLDFALMAFALLAPKYPHIAYVAIGEGEEKEKLEKLARDLGIAEKTHFLGRIPDAGSLIKAFDIFTLTSRTESLPYTVLEAGLAETAIVASRVGGIPEIIDNAKNGLVVEPGNVKEIKEALSDLIEHPAKREKLGKALKKTVEKKFSLEKMVSETVKVYGFNAD